TQNRPVIATVSTSQNSSVDMVSPHLACISKTPIALTQSTADLDRGHDSILENYAALVVNVTVCSSPHRLKAIDVIGFAPTRCLHLFGGHAEAGLTSTLALGRSLRRINVRSKGDQLKSANVSCPAIL